MAMSMEYVGKTTTDRHSRPCWAFRRDRSYYLLASATVPKQGYYYEFDVDLLKLLLGRLPKERPLTFQEFSRELAEVEGTGLRNQHLDRRADYFVQLLKILGLAEFEGKDGGKLLYIIHPRVNSHEP